MSVKIFGDSQLSNNTLWIMNFHYMAKIFWGEYRVKGLPLNFSDFSR
ncbi:hypothetical protein PSEUDO8Z_10427 [Pseudomonas sp. 8Z]|nr:hypothetical protein PSEUDO8Z_10427 [Pseudomonas sp. 8Z]